MGKKESSSKELKGTKGKEMGRNGIYRKGRIVGRRDRTGNEAMEGCTTWNS
jgi:hypothetical protein